MSRYNITTSIFQKAKHNPPLAEEEIELCRMIICRDQNFSDEILENSLHSSIYAFALSQGPTDENIALIVPYVDPIWDDYITWAAVRAIFGIWA